MLQTPPRYAPYIGGVEAVAQALAERHRASGLDVSVVCADEPGGAPPVWNGVPVIRLPWVGKVANTNISLGLPLALLRGRFDVVHTHLPTPWWSDWSVLVARLRGKRVVLTFHNETVATGGAGFERALAAIYRTTAERLVLRLSHVVLVLSEPWRDHLVCRQPALAGKVHVIPNGVDLERLAPPNPSERTTDLLFVARLDRFHRYKGLGVLLDALPRVPTARLRVVGDGELRPAYEAQAARLGIADRVAFLGVVDDAELLALYWCCGTFVLPSDAVDHEGGSSLVVLEAMAAGLQVIVAEGAGDIARQVEAAGVGWRAGAGDVEGLATAIAEAVSDVVGARQRGDAARRHVEALHGWEAIAAQVSEHYLP